ncbi:MAG: hypothetical protein L6Q97_23160, partial [Thermoanaerobaculia bacterium]|nr:hypothetical protein [Thermoanaerobaculia bacterium]
LNLFADGGVAFYKTDDFDRESPYTGVIHKPVFSVGASVRFNLFGALILEPFYAYPISAEKDARRWYWGLNIVPGW